MNEDLNIAEVLYESGEVRFRYARVLSEDGKHWLKHGLFVEYHQDGQVLSEGTYHLGQEHGPWRDIHPNGQVAAEGRYEQGKEHGVWHFWNEAGVEERTVN